MRRGLPLKELLSYVLDPAPRDRVMNIAFILVLLLGGAALAVASMVGSDFSKAVPRAFVGMYVSFWIAYGLWFLDLIVGLPWGWSRFYVVPIFLSVALVFFIVYELVAMWNERYRPLEQGYRRCPHP